MGRPDFQRDPDSFALLQYRPCTMNGIALTAQAVWAVQIEHERQTVVCTDRAWRDRIVAPQIVPFTQARTT
jgi:hypothetical protein